MLKYLVVVNLELNQLNLIVVVQLVVLNLVLGQNLVVIIELVINALFSTRLSTKLC
jgi:hypothetical protein